MELDTFENADLQTSTTCTQLTEYYELPIANSVQTSGSSSQSSLNSTESYLGSQILDSLNNSSSYQVDNESSHDSYIDTDHYTLTNMSSSHISTLHDDTDLDSLESETENSNEFIVPSQPDIGSFSQIFPDLDSENLTSQYNYSNETSDTDSEVLM